jgi:TM2 domain-containing membrane protein YozV
MDNFSGANQYRRYKAHLSMFGTTQFHLRNPYIIAWWSAAFPGFGHLLLAKYLRGLLLFVWEVFINMQSHLNIAMVYSFCGEIDKARDALDYRWTLLYIPVYIFAIWDSYRTTIDSNRVFLLAERENAPFNTFSIGAVEINYLDKKNPRMAVIWSFLMPGTGQLYIHRLITGFFALVWTVVFVYYSKCLLAVHFLFLGQVQHATDILNPSWLMFVPSVYGFAVYDAYINTVENNKLFIDEQRNFLVKNYQHYRVKFPDKV